MMRIKCFLMLAALQCLAVLSGAEFGKEWVLFGPYASLPPGLPEALQRTIPDSLNIAGTENRGIRFVPKNGKADFAALLKKKMPRKAFYVCIPVFSEKGGKLPAGFGADWYMDVYLNGSPVGNTMTDGNGVWPPGSRDHEFFLNLKAGKNLLVAGVIGGTGSQQFCFKPGPVLSPNVRKKISAIRLGKEQLPSLRLPQEWQQGNSKYAFQPNEAVWQENHLKLSIPRKSGKNAVRRMAAAIHLEPGMQYMLNWSAWTRRGEVPTLLICEKAEGGMVYLAKKLVNGRNKTGYFYCENPECYAVIEMRGEGESQIFSLSLKKRLDRTQAFQDWRLQRFPAPSKLISCTDQVKTPHFQFAPHFPGGTLKLFYVTSFWYQRNAFETAQRFDMECKGIFTAGNATPPPSVWIRSGNGEVVLKNMADDLAKASGSECIWIDGCGASAITKKMASAIIKEVKRGTGLVISAYDQPYYPYKDGKRESSIKKLKALFAPLFAEKCTQDTDFVHISAAGKQTAEFGQYGKGRAVLLLSAENIFSSQRLNFEIRAALTGKAILWASNRVPENRITAFASKDGNFSVTTSGKGDIRLTVADERCTVLSMQEQTVSSGTSVVSSPGRNSGKLFSFITLSSDGKNQDWDLLLEERHTKNILKKITLTAPRPELRGKVSLQRTLLPEEKAQLLLKDGTGILWRKLPLEGKGKQLTFALSTKGIPAEGGELTIQILNGKNEVVDFLPEKICLSLPDDPENPDFSLGVWGIPVSNYPARLYYTALREKYKLNYMLSGNNNKQPLEVLDMNIRSVPYAAPGQLAFGTTNQITGAPAAPERKLCLSSPELKKDLAKRIRAVFDPLRNMAAKYCFLDHETNLLGYIHKAAPGSDYCFSSSCLASLRELMKKEYKSLDALNAAWETSFKNWEEVKPQVLKEAASAGSAPRWIDHRRNMDKVWTDLAAFRISEAQKYDPSVRGYIQNLHSGYSSNDSFSGIDYEELLNCDLVGAAMPESYLNAFTRPENRAGNAQGGSMWPTCGGAVDDTELSCLRSVRVIWQTLLMGQGSCLYYLHNWNNHGLLLFNDLFMVYPDLSMSPEGKALSDGLKRLYLGTDRLILTAKQDDSGISMLYSRSSEHACTYWQEVCKGNPLARTLNPRSQQFDFFAPAVERSHRSFSSVGCRKIAQGELLKKNQRLLILPFAQSITPEAADAIRKFVRNGGTVIADFRPAVADRHGVTGKQGMLDDVFGIRQKPGWDFCPVRSSASVGKVSMKQVTAGEALQLAGAEALGNAGKIPVWIVNRFGKGKAVLLNFATDDPAFRELFRKELDSLNIPELFTCRELKRVWYSAKGDIPESQVRKERQKNVISDKSATEDAGERETLIYENSSSPRLHRYINGNASILGYYACRRGFALGKGEMHIAFGLEKPAYVYDLISGESLGRVQTWKKVMPLEGVALYAAIPFQPQPPECDRLAVRRTGDGAVKLHVRIRLPQEARTIAYPVHLKITDPAGKEIPGAKCVTVRNREIETELDLPADAAPGQWKLFAREVFAGKTAAENFTL